MRLCATNLSKFWIHLPQIAELQKTNRRENKNKYSVEEAVEIACRYVYWMGRSGNQTKSD